MYREKKRNKRILMALIGILCLMSVGYAAFYTDLNIKNSGYITSSWDIEIINVTSGTATGSAKNVVAPTWDVLTANMEANLYDKGDAMEYVVTIKNKGTIDAVLDNITKDIQSNNDAIKITFSGYTKGERLYINQEKTITVRIEYDSNYEETIDYSVSSEVSVTFNYKQAAGIVGDPQNPEPTRYLLTYDYTTNGGRSSNAENEYLNSGTTVTLSGDADKDGYEFIGWNTDRDAHVAQNTVTLNSSTTVYAIFKKKITVSYEKGLNVSTLGGNSDSYTGDYYIYNNEPSTNITLPAITTSYNNATLWWYEDDTQKGHPNDSYTLTEPVTLVAKALVSPVIKSWAEGADTDFHNSTYRENITSVVFEDSIEIPEGATYWDVSAQSGSSAVMAWVTEDPEDNTKYILHIAGEGGVIANEDSSFIFKDFTSAKEIVFGNNYDTSNVTNMESMFEMSSSLTSLDVSSFDTSKVTNMSYMFGGFDNTNQVTMSLTEINGLDSFDTSKVTTMAAMFMNCGYLTTLDLSSFDTSNVTTMRDMFNGPNAFDSHLTTIIFGQNWDTSKVTDMHAMFCDCVSLTDIDLTMFDTSNVTDMSLMFSYCQSITELDLSLFNTSKVTTMEKMFMNCGDLTTLDLSSFDTSNVTTMADMINGPNTFDSHLSTIIFGQNWDTSNVTNMSHMFADLVSLTTLDLSSFDTSKVTIMEGMFIKCINLTKLKLCSFNTADVTNMDKIFQNTTNMQSIYVGPNWTTANATTTDMFSGSGVSAVTQSNNCEYDAETITVNASTTSTTNSITVVADAYADSGIVKYEFSLNKGSTWVNNGNNNTYTFTGLPNDTGYPLYVRVTSNLGKTAIYKTDSLDSTVPTNSLLYWGEAGNSNNTSTTLKNKVSGTDGTLKNFAGTTSSGYKGDALVFDGTDDFVNIGRANYNFNNSISYVAYVRLNNTSPKKYVISNVEGAGSALFFTEDQVMSFMTHNGTNWTYNRSGITPNTNDYYTIIATYDGTNSKIYMNGQLLGTQALSQITTSTMPILIGANPNTPASNPTPVELAKMNLKEAMVYDRALTSAEVTKITNNMNKKYSVYTLSIEKPTFTKTDTSTGANIKITYPSGCTNGTYTCKYKKDNGSEVNVTTSTVTVPFTSSGQLVATVSDGTSTSSASYTYTRTLKATLSKGDNVSSIGATSVSCNVPTGSTSCTVTLPTITAASHYTALGWYNGSTKVGNASATVTLTGNVSYTAKSRLNQLKIKYHMNGGTWAGSTNTHLSYSGSYVTYDSNQVVATYNYGATVNLADYNNPDYINIGKSGYIGKSGAQWCTAASGGTCFNHSTDYTAQQISSALANGDRTVTLYVNWVQNNALYVSSSGNDSTGFGTQARPYKTIAKAYSMAPTTATIYVMNTITLTSRLAMGSSKTITLTSASGTQVVQKTSALSAATISVTTGTLTLKTITIDGKSVSDTNHGVGVSSGARLNLQAGGTIRNFKNTGSNGAGVVVASGGTFAMSGGTISGCTPKEYGGGVLCNGTCTFTGGTITSNTASSGGGISSGGTVTINGTTITNNKGKSQAGGVFAGAGSTLTISSGTISSNTCEGWYGGGVKCNGTCRMTGGTIASNKCTCVGSSCGSDKCKGGGVHIGTAGSFTLSGGIIKKNTAQDTGGIYKTSSGTYSRSGGYVCKNNSPTNSYDTTDTSNSNCS